MLAMTSVIVDYAFNNMFVTFYIFYRCPPNVAGSEVTYPLTLPLDGNGCINNALINALKINAVRKCV